MRARVLWRSDPERSILDPLLERNGFVLRLIYGSCCDPWNGQWFGPKWPTIILRFYSLVPFPFISWRVGNWTGYLGAKVYGVHHEEYKNWLPAHEIYNGSTAFCFSARPFAKPE